MNRERTIENIQADAPSLTDDMLAALSDEQLDSLEVCVMDDDCRGNYPDNYEGEQEYAAYIERSMVMYYNDLIA